MNRIESAPGILEFLALRWNNLTQKLISAGGENNTYQQLLNHSCNASNGKNQMIGVQLFIVTCFIGRNYEEKVGNFPALEGLCLVDRVS